MNEPDFSRPTRQSGLAIFLIFGQTAFRVARQLLPVIVVLFLRWDSEEDTTSYFWYTGLALLPLLAIWAIVSYYFTWFIIEDQRLIVHTGVVQRKKTSISLDRIQSLQLEQPFFHQLLDVHRVKVETAGADQSEVSLYALTQEVAMSLRELILPHSPSDTLQSPGEEALDDDISGEEYPKKDVWMVHDIVSLFRLGLTHHHLKSGWVLFLFFFWVLDGLREVGVDLETYSEQALEWQPALGTILFFLVFILFIVLVLSVGLTFLRYWDFRWVRVADGFVISYGLLTRQEKSARDKKVQYIQWSDNWLKKWAGIYDVQLFQATGYVQKTPQRISVPGCSQAQVDRLVNLLFDARWISVHDWQSPHASFFYRFALILSGGLLAGVGLSYAFGLWELVFPALIPFTYWLLHRYLAWRRWKYALASNIVYLKRGVFADRNLVVPLEKIQTIALRQNPFQRPRQLCTLDIHTAAGTVTLPYIPVNEGKELVRAFLAVTSDRVNAGL